MKNGVTINSNCWITPKPDGTYMPYDKAIDLAFKLSKEETDGWRYTVEIIASDPRNAKIAVFDENNIKMGYL